MAHPYSPCFYSPTHATRPWPEGGSPLQSPKSDQAKCFLSVPFYLLHSALPFLLIANFATTSPPQSLPHTNHTLVHPTRKSPTTLFTNTQNEVLHHPPPARGPRHRRLLGLHLDGRRDLNLRLRPSRPNRRSLRLHLDLHHLLHGNLLLRQLNLGHPHRHLLLRLQQLDLHDPGHHIRGPHHRPSLPSFIHLRLPSA